MVGKFTWGNKAKHCWVMSTNFFFSKSLLTMPSNGLSLHLKETFPPIILIFTEGYLLKSFILYKFQFSKNFEQWEQVLQAWLAYLSFFFVKNNLITLKISRFAISDEQNIPCCKTYVKTLASEGREAKVLYRVSHMYLDNFVRLFRGHWVT